MPMPMPDAADLADMIKLGQRVSKSWSAAWCLYCEQNAGGTYDPLRQQAHDIQDFIELAGALTLKELGCTRRLQQQQQEPPAKRSRSANMVNVAGLPGTTHSLGATPGISLAKDAMGQTQSSLAEGSQENHRELVETVKTLQRTDPQKKQLWVEFCDSYGSGIKDPNRHDAATLQDFIEKVLKMSQ